ncbi:AfsR/SARP family transcriptional regulator [Allorhizocola rhizosphaerae]|uniref:AfsR/SARP family transcriptional regulator n=1 Tax=Allorhizocola rhizosphaerae TaxID=1872709 RepID=UPI000E3E8EA2|nr:BTAD domain-containing putative transcriptional regulator [Allorhizocola rhizosphaerae]
MSVEIRLLGPVQIAGESGAVRLGGIRMRTLFGLLALRAPDVVSQTALIDGVWDGDPPANASKTLRAHIAHLRKLLADGGCHGERARKAGRWEIDSLITTRSPGYALCAPAESLDVHWFEHLVDRGRLAVSRGAVAASVENLRTALSLWRGDALADCMAGRWAQAEVTRLHEVRMAVTEELLAAELMLGRHARVVAELQSLVTCYPLRERLWELLMLSLYEAGRPGDALHAYQRARSTMVSELGLEPGPRLRNLELAILSGS